LLGGKLGVILTLRFDQKIGLPDWMAGWYTQVLFKYIYEAQGGAGVVPNTIGDLVNHFGIDIQPLLKLGGQDFSLEEYGGNKELFERVKKHNQACWQAPQKLIDCLKVFVEKIDENPEVLFQLDVKDNYFLQGEFKKDLVELIRMAEWAKEHGVKKVRLEAG
jgi:hypothetical protein